MLLWSGQTASYFGDAFFNLAVMWVVWSETQSTLQTAIIQAVWHIPDIIFAPLAGVLADRWDRKAIMVTTNVAAASVVGAVVLLVVLVGHLPPVVAFVAIFKLNGLTTFMNPARASIMPSVVGRDLLTTAQGLFSTARETAALAGSATAGLVIAAAGAVWALAVDAASFLFVSLCIAIARLPGRVRPNRCLEQSPCRALPKVGRPGPARRVEDGLGIAGRARIAMARRAHQRRIVHRATVARPRTGAAGWRGRFLRRIVGGFDGRRHDRRPGCRAI